MIPRLLTRSFYYGENIKRQDFYLFTASVTLFPCEVHVFRGAVRGGLCREVSDGDVTGKWAVSVCGERGSCIDQVSRSSEGVMLMLQ